MGALAIGRKNIEAKGAYQLRELQLPYVDDFGAKKSEMGLKYAYFWQ